MDHPLRPVFTRLPARSWRTAAIVAGGVATAELVLLVLAGGALLSGHGSDGQAARPAVRAAPHHRPAPDRAAKQRHRKAAVSSLARSRVSVVVLNGNGRRGAAHSAAGMVRRHGYRISSVGNAAHMGYGRSFVMFRAGFEAAGRRLARDLGVRRVGPLDGLRPAQLHGAQAVLVVGR